MDLASVIDHTLLKPDATADHIRKLCQEAVEYGFCSVCVNPVWVPLCAGELQGRQPLVCSVAGFPLGATPMAAGEAEWAVSRGAGEIDMVIPVGYLKAGNRSGVLQSIEDVVKAVPGIPVKVILETCLLNRAEKVLACELSEEAGAAFVKTSTGFAGGGATVEDIALMSETVGGRLGVKASGGIRTRQDALAMIGAGATRIGASSSIAIVNGNKKNH